MIDPSKPVAFLNTPAFVAKIKRIQDLALSGDPLASRAIRILSIESPAINNVCVTSQGKLLHDLPGTGGVRRTFNGLN